MAERVGPTRPAPPISPPHCALGQLRGGGRVCYGDVPGVIHSAACPQARREARERALWAWVTAGLVSLALIAWALVILGSIAARTCGLGAGAC